MKYTNKISILTASDVSISISIHKLISFKSLCMQFISVEFIFMLILFNSSLCIISLQIAYLEGIIRSHESGIAELEADNVRLTQVSFPYVNLYMQS